MKEWHLLLAGVVFGVCYGIFWAFDYDLERLRQAAVRVALGTAIGFLAALLGLYLARVQALRR